MDELGLWLFMIVLISMPYLIDCGDTIFYKYMNGVLMCFSGDGEWVGSNTGLSYFSLNPKPINKAN